MEPIQGNKLIAEFMGAESFGGSDKWLQGVDPYPHAMHIESLEYHTSWDWLMPVADKAYRVAEEIEDRYRGDTDTTQFRANLGGATSVFLSGLIGFDIGTAYKGLCGMIGHINTIQDHYNQNKA